MKKNPVISSSTEATYEADRKIRKTWAIPPIMKVIPNKKKNYKLKHKGKEYDYD